MRRSSKFSLLLASTLSLSWLALAQTDRVARFPEMSRAAEKAGLAEEFKGITTNGAGRTAACSRSRSTGVSTEPVRVAAEAFLAALTERAARARRCSRSTTSSGASG